MNSPLQSVPTAIPISGYHIMESKCCIWIQFVVYILVINICRADGRDTVSPGPGRWEVVIENGGVSAMHMATTIMGTVVMYDYTDFGDSNISLANGICIGKSAGYHDCSAHSIEYNIATNKVRPLTLTTDTWCSSGAFAADGTLVSTGGWGDGNMTVRKFVPCETSTCDWVDPAGEPGSGLLNDRWYASNQILPDGRSIVVGGNYAFTYEFLPPRKPGEGVYNLTFLEGTYVSQNLQSLYNLYPFLHLSSDGNLFIFANRDSILLDYQRNVVVRHFPRIPDGPRNYPTTASSVMLPLSASDAFRRTEIMICGGAPVDSYNLSLAGIFIDALQSCGRMVITDPNADWAMENMPAPRVVGDMLLLPTGEILIINGAEKGCAGYGQATNPALAPYLYRPNALPGQRFSVLASSTVPRMYHSTAIVLPDGRIFVGGSNPNKNYNFTVTFPTELRLQAYSPYYLDESSLKPTIISVLPASVTYGGSFKVQFAANNHHNISIQFNIYPPTFTTHSFSMHQRLLLLASATPQLELVGGAGQNIYSALVTAPPTPVAAPPGYYMLFVLNSGIPSAATWIHLSSN